jgi:phage baseplate assembly protein V
MSDFFPSFGTQGESPVINNMLRTGVVVEQDPATCRVRVQYPDRDSVTTYWLPVLHRTAAGSKEFSVPNLGDQVHVLHFPDSMETGIVLGTTFTTLNPPPQLKSANPPGPVGGPNAHHTFYVDGSYEEYDPGSSTKTLNTQGPVNTVTVGPYTITSTNPITITSSGNVMVNGMIVDPSGNVTVPGSLTVNGFTNCKGGGQTNPHMSNVDGLSTNAC